MLQSPELAAGELDRILTLLSPVYNDPQDEIVDWTPVEDVWGSVNPTQGVEGTSSGRTVAQTYAIVTIRFRTDIDQRWRIQDGATVYKIEGQLNTLARGAGLRMNCLEVR